MKFGVVVPCWEPFASDPSRYQSIAAEAERLEYDYLFVNNHFLRQSVEIRPELVKRHATMEAWSLLAYIAAKTEKIMIGSSVTPLPLYNPVMLAKIVATVDNLSNGRVVLGAGAGYDKSEFDAYGSWDPDGVRVSKTEEALILMKRLWTEDIVNFEGKYYLTKNAVLQPRPIQKPYPPIAIGAMSERMFRITAQQADIWLPSRSVGATPEFYEKARAKILAAAKKCNRKVQFGLFGQIIEEVRDSSYRGRPAIGSMKDCIGQLERYRSLGCEIVMTNFFPVEKYNELMERFQREVVSSFS